MKHINGWKISKILPQCKAYVKYFSDAKTQCMKDYLKLTRGTNDLKSEKPSKAIATEIMNIAVSLKSKACDVSVLHTRI